MEANGRARLQAGGAHARLRREDARAMKKRILNTLKKRLVLTVCVCVLGGLIPMAAVSNMILQFSEQTRLKSILKSDLHQFSELMDKEYYTLVQMSQQMSADGLIGKDVMSYFSTAEPYERILLTSNITASINTMIFSHQNITMVSYLLPQRQESLFSIMPMRQDPSFSDIPLVMESGSIALQVPHQTLNNYMKKDIISITRRFPMSNGEDLFIYVEAFPNFEEYFHTLEQIRGFPYAFLLCSENGQILYSTCAEYSSGTLPAQPEGEIGRLGAYSSITEASDMGFQYVLLMPAAEYDHILFRWTMGFISVLLLTFVMTALSIFLLIHLIYRPIQTLSHDMAQAGRGDFSPVNRQFHMEEFDSLFRRFDEMKTKISALIENNSQQEKEKRQLEIDKLYYQINPHFLMNALNSVHWMAVANHQPGIDRFIYQLNYILGYSLGKTDKRSTFRTELKSLEVYLDLQQTRYDFDVEMDIEPGDYLDYPCARLILQPLAENAVCHNMNDFGLLRVSMHALKEDSRRWVRISICDDGHGISGLVSGQEISQINKGIGLRYVQMSLESYYGGKASLQLHSEPGRGTEVCLLLPIQKKGEPHVSGSDH